MKPLRLCYYCDEYPPGIYGGVGKYVQTVARALAEAGHQTQVVGVYSQLAEHSREVDRGVVVERLPRPKPDKGGVRRRILAYQTIAARARRGEIDLVEVPDGSGWAALWPKLNVPVVTRVHGSISYFAQEAGKEAAWFDRWVERRSLQRSDFWCSSSHYAANRTREIFSLRSEAQVIYNPGAHLGEGDPCVSFRSTQRDGGLVVFAGTLTAKKGVGPLLQAWPTVLKGRPDARLLLYGKGDPGPWRSSLPESCRPSVEFRGHASQEELQRVYQTARAAVFPSFAEAFALAPMEAMANCCPTIYSKHTSGPELIEDGRDGLLIDPKRPEEIANAIERLLGNDDDAERLGDAGRQRILERFTTRQIIPELTEFYSRCCASFGLRNARSA